MHTGAAQTLQDGGPLTIRSGFLVRVSACLAVLAALSAGIAVAGKWAGGVIAMGGHTDDATLREVVIGADALAVPSNMIRFDAARRSGPASRLDLYLRWPQMDGYSHAARDAFNHAGGDRTVLFVSFEPRIMSRDMSGRYEPIYRVLVEEEGRPGPAGLTVHRFTEKSGYVDEVLVVADAGGENPFVMRCLAGAAARDSLAPCERDIHVGNGLNLVYRMPSGLAGQWREIDAKVRAAAAGFLGGAARH